MQLMNKLFSLSLYFQTYLMKIDVAVKQMELGGGEARRIRMSISANAVLI